MPSSIPPTHVGDDVIHSLREKCWPIIQDKEENPDFEQLAWGHLCAVLGQSLQRYFNYDSPERIAWAQYETGEILKGWYAGVENPYPKPSFDNVHPFPYKGIMRVDGNGYYGAEGYQYPMGIHFGDGFLCYTEGKDPRPVLDDFMKYGFHFTRTWITLMYNKQGHPGHFWGTRGCSPRVTPNYFNWLQKWIDMHIERGLKMHLSMGDLAGIPQQELENLYDNVANLIRVNGPEHFIFPGEVNESRDTFPEADGNRISGLVNRIRQVNPDLLYALTSFTGYADLDILKTFTASYQQAYYKHGYRDGNFWDKLRHTFSDGYEYYNQIRKFGADHEPVGPGRWVSATANKGEIDAAMMGLMAVMAALSRQSYLYFCSPGIKWDEDFHNMPGYTTVAKLVNLIPRGLTRGTLHHSGNTWRNIRVFSAVDEFRVDGALNEATGEGAYVCYGPGNRIKLPVNRSFDGQIINPETLQVSNISARSGEYLPEIGYNKGFVVTVKLK